MTDHGVEKLKTDLASGRMSRRGFMQALMASGATIAVASAIADQAMAATPTR